MHEYWVSKPPASMQTVPSVVPGATTASTANFSPLASSASDASAAASIHGNFSSNLNPFPQSPAAASFINRGAIHFNRTAGSRSEMQPGPEQSCNPSAAPISGGARDRSKQDSYGWFMATAAQPFAAAWWHQSCRQVTWIHHMASPNLLSFPTFQ